MSQPKDPSSPHPWSSRHSNNRNVWQTRAFTPSSHRRDNAATLDPPEANLPLSGTLVVSLEQAIAGPFCTRQLADLGARVIKIERPGVGDFNRHHDQRVKGLCSHFVWTNRSKESLALDLKKPADLAALKAIVAQADVLVQNLAPGSTQRMGLSHDTLRHTHPRLIVCDISGYGATGPYRHKKAYDLLIQAESGFLSVTGTPASMAKSGISIADIAAGTTASHQILAAVIARARTGRGCRLDVSMLESMAEWMGFPLYYGYDGAAPPRRAGAEHASIYPYGLFSCADGAVVLGMQNEREWAAFARDVLRAPGLLRDDRFATTALRSEHRVELKGVIEDVFRALASEEVMERLEGAGIANARVTDVPGLWAHPQLRARGRWAEVDSEVGKIPALKPAGAADGMHVRMERIPRVGEDSERILREFGVRK